MIQVLRTIKLKGGEQVELLATPALFGIAKRKGMTIEADADNVPEVMSAYTKLVYLAALNAWEVRRFDAPEMGDCHYKLMDFTEWASADMEEFTSVVNFLLCALTKKELKDYTNEGVKPLENPEKTADTPSKEEVKKKSISTWITRLFRRS